MQKHNHVLANFLILLSLGGVSWALWTLYRSTNPTFDPWLLPFAVGGAFGVGLVFSLVFNFAAKTNIAVIAFSTVLAAYAGNYMLELTGRNLLHIFDAKVVREQVSVAPALPQRNAAREPFVSPRPPVSRDSNPVYKALVDSGIDTGFMYGAPQLLPLVADGSLPAFLPLSTRANTVTLMCNEGDQREFPIIRTDRYGFNNDDTVHALPG